MQRINPSILSFDFEGLPSSTDMLQKVKNRLPLDLESTILFECIEKNFNFEWLTLNERKYTDVNRRDLKQEPN